MEELIWTVDNTIKSKSSSLFFIAVNISLTVFCLLQIYKNFSRILPLYIFLFLSTESIIRPTNPFIF